MRVPQKILVPIDFSERSHEGVRYATLLARPLGASLVLMSCVAGQERPALEDLARRERLDLAAMTRLQLDVLANRLAPDLETLAVADFHDDVAAGILAVADAERADLIVIASHGRSRIKRMVLGSVARSVVTKAHLPVTIVPVWDPAAS